MKLPDLEIRIQQLLDDELTEEQFAELETELLENPEAMALYLSYSGLDSDLRHQSSYQKKAEQLPIVPVEELLAQQRKRAVRISLLSAAAVLMILAVIMWFQSVPNTPDTIAEIRATPGSDFTLTHKTDDKIPDGNVMVENSRIVLRHGAIELKLPYDVRAIIEAPAAVTMLDDRTLGLDYGSAYFKVTSTEGQGFAVVTPHQRIVDLGTAFGVHCINGENETVLHVLEGEVRVDDRSGKHGKVIKAKRALVLAGTRILRKIDASTVNFRHILPPKVEMLLKEDFVNGLIANQEYAVQIDNSVIRDLNGNRFSGLDDKTPWKFNTRFPDSLPVPIASYTYTGTSGPSDRPSLHRPQGHQKGIFTDHGNKKLKDKRSGDPSGWGSGAYVGFQDLDDTSSPEVTFDLGTPNEVYSITVHSLIFDKATSLIEVSVSSDGKTFSNPVQFEPQWSGLKQISTTLYAPNWGSARYYRLKFVHPGQWLFLGEVEFNSANVSNIIATDKDLEELHPEEKSYQPLTKRDISPPTPIAFYPKNGSRNWISNGQLKLVFNEPIQFGTGRVRVQNINNWEECEIVVGSRELAIGSRTLTINPLIQLDDGARKIGWPADWKCLQPVTFFNPDGSLPPYENRELVDSSSTRGLLKSMRNPSMISIQKPIRRDIGSISASMRYTVSATIGVRVNDANNPSTFLGYTIRLCSGNTTLAQISNKTPPGPANSMNTVGLSWDSSNLPDNILPDDPLTIEISPTSGQEPGYLDLNSLRISALRISGN